MMSNATFNNVSVILWQSVLLVEETGVPGESHRPVVSHWQRLENIVLSNSHNVFWSVAQVNHCCLTLKKKKSAGF